VEDTCLTLSLTEEFIQVPNNNGCTETTISRVMKKAQEDGTLFSLETIINQLAIALTQEFITLLRKPLQEVPKSHTLPLTMKIIINSI